MKTKINKLINLFGMNNCLKRIFLLMVIVLSIIKTYAQNNEQEAILTYQMAQEAFDNKNYSDAIKYLDKVETLEPTAKNKTSYLKAHIDYIFAMPEKKSFSPGASLSQIRPIRKCMENIIYYLENGKDEEKKKNLLKMKIAIENSDVGIAVKKFSNITYDEAWSIVSQILKKNGHYSSTKKSQTLTSWGTKNGYFYANYYNRDNGMETSFVTIMELKGTSISPYISSGTNTFESKDDNNNQHFWRVKSGWEYSGKEDIETFISNCNGNKKVWSHVGMWGPKKRISINEFLPSFDDRTMSESERIDIILAFEIILKEYNP